MKYLKQKGVWKAMLSLFVVVMLATFCIVACSKDDVMQSEQNQAESVEKSFIEKNHLTKISDIHLVSQDENGATIAVSPFASLFFLPKNTPHYEAYLKLAVSKRNEPNLRKVTINPVIMSDIGKGVIAKIELLSKEELENQAHSHLLSRDGKKLSAFRSSSLSSSMTEQRARYFFNSFKKMTCPLTPMAHCIPFQWTRDGCQARAHYMKKLMEDEGYGCKKIFAYASDENVLLSVVNTKGSCVQWVYHVAPLVRVHGIGNMVIDPSLFDEPVLTSTWLNRMKSNCSGAGIPDIKLKITSSDIYYENYYTGYREYDEDYSKTYEIMRLFSDDEEF